MRQISYSVFVTLSTGTGFVRDSSCECKSSALGRCSHIAAVLYAVNDCLSTSDSTDTNEPCTSKPCTWNMGRKQKKNPMCITETKYKSKRKPVSSIIEFDPRPESLRKTELTPEENDDFIKALQTFKPEGSQSVSMWETVLFIKYEDYNLSPDEISVLKQKVDNLVQNLTPNIHGPTEITQCQNNKHWLSERYLRVTPSNARSIYAASSDKRRENIIKLQLWDTSPKTAAMIYGQKHEDTARQQFMTQFINLKVENSGLWVNGKYPGLGASPDAVL